MKNGGEREPMGPIKSHSPMKDSIGEKSIKAFLAEKRLMQSQHSQLQRIERSRDAQIKRLETMSSGLQLELASYGQGMTNLGEYFTTEPRDSDHNTIVFPLVRTREDWEAKPCCLGKAAVNENRCYHFPCRNFTSYHFMFRSLPKFILDRANESVRRSKEESDVTDDVRKTSPEIGQQEQSTVLKLPVIEFPENMTNKEKKLKTIIHKKRVQNEMENKPPDRNVNYGKPTAIRRLKRAVRPALRHMDIR